MHLHYVCHICIATSKKKDSLFTFFVCSKFIQNRDTHKDHRHAKITIYQNTADKSTEIRMNENRSTEEKSYENAYR